MAHLRKMEATPAFEALTDPTKALTTVGEEWTITSEEQVMDEDLASSLWLGIALIGLAPAILGGNCLVIAAFALDRWVHDSLHGSYILCLTC